MSKTINYTQFCLNKNCEEYIRWSFDMGECESCKRVGQSYTIDAYPEDCLFLDEIKAFEREQNVL